MTHQTRCHYEILSIPRDADAAAVKKAHRRLALLHHPDKNTRKSATERSESEAEFKLIQAAYECLSDPTERRWYDEHREAILRGGARAGVGADGSSFLFDVVPYVFAGCCDGWLGPGGFYAVYGAVFAEIFRGEKNGYLSEGGVDFDEMPNAHLGEVRFGDAESEWSEVAAFYGAWEGFISCLSFGWEDVYHLDDLKEAPNRRIRRLMEEDNRKKRKAAKKERQDEVCALVRFVKRRDPRVVKQRELAIAEQNKKEAEKKKEAAKRKEEIAAAKEEWLAEAEQNMREQEAADLDAGRIRLADLDSDDEYGGKRGRKKKGKKRGKKNRQSYIDEDSDEQEVPEAETWVNGVPMKDAADGEAAEPDATTNAKEQNDDIQQTETEQMDIPHADEDDLSQSSSEESSEPDTWRCECCRKDFKSEKQFDNHAKSKKHKEMLKKYEKKLQKEAVGDMLNEIG